MNLDCFKFHSTHLKFFFILNIQAYIFYTRFVFWNIFFNKNINGSWHLGFFFFNLLIEIWTVEEYVSFIIEHKTLRLFSTPNSSSLIFIVNNNPQLKNKIEIFFFTCYFFFLFPYLIQDNTKFICRCHCV